MAYNFKNLADVELLEEVPEEATAFVELNGSIKRVPSKGLGGEGGIKTAIIKDSVYDDAILAQVNPRDARITYECLNMTFEEAYTTMVNGEQLACFGMLAIDGPTNLYGTAVFEGIYNSVPSIAMVFKCDGGIISLIWTADELYMGSTESES
jgi:hypothetical protein